MYDYSTSFLQREQIVLLEDILEILTSINGLIGLIVFVICIKFVISIVRSCL